MKNVLKFLAIAALGVTPLAAPFASAAFVIVNEPVTANVQAAPIKEQLLFNKTTLPVVHIGEGEASRVGGQGTDVPLSVATPMIVPVGWSIYALTAGGDDKGLVDSLRISWTNSSTWIDVLRVMAINNDLQVVVDWTERKITINPLVERGRWQQGVAETSEAIARPVELPTVADDFTLNSYLNLIGPGYSKILYVLEDRSAAERIRFPAGKPVDESLALHGIFLREASDIADGSKYLVVSDQPYPMNASVGVLGPRSTSISNLIFDIGRFYGWYVGRPNEYVWLETSNPQVGSGGYQVVTSIDDALTVALSGRRLKAELSGNTKTIYIKSNALFKWGIK